RPSRSGRARCARCPGGWRSRRRRVPNRGGTPSTGCRYRQNGWPSQHWVSSPRKRGPIFAAAGWVPVCTGTTVTQNSDLLLSQPLRGIERRDDDILVAGAAAEIARNGDPHLLLGRVGVIAQELEQRGQHAGRAIAALQPVMFVERLLQRMQLVGRGRDA